MKWIGLTGGIATGKSTVSKILQTKGYAVVDADLLARKVVERGSQGLASVVSAFGSEVLSADGALDRKKMASMVFANPEKLKKLESILHPLIRSEVSRIQTELKNRGELVAFYDVPLLFEKNMQDQFDAILVVAATKDQQLERLQVRDQWTPEQINQRLANQLDLQQKKAQADYVILNTGSLKDLETQVEQVLIKMGLGKK